MTAVVTDQDTLQTSRITPVSNRRFARVMTAGFALLAFTSCREKTEPAIDNSVANGGTVNIAVPTDARTLYPPMAEDALDLAVINSVYDRLADIPENLNTVGDSGYVKQLADGWTWANDSLSIAFHINPKARWHDGEPVRAQDVKFTFQAYTKPAGPNTDYLSNIDSVSMSDSLTAVVWFKRRMPQQFYQATNFMHIIPQHLYGKIAPDKIADDSTVQSPVGSGRFRFGKRVLRQRIELLSDTANYNGRAKLDRVVFAIYDGAPAAILSVFGGENDFFEKLRPEDLAEIPRKPTLRAQSFSQIGYGFMTFNLFARKKRDVSHPIFGDVNVRRALTLAIDRIAMTRAVFDTFGVVGIGPSPRSLMPNYDKLKQLTFDRAHAQALLDSAGWTLPAGATIRTRNGVPLEFNIVVSNTSRPRQDLAASIENQLRGVGAKASVQIVEGMVLRAEVESGNFDAYMGALNITPGLQGILQSWGKSGIGVRNFGGYTNPKFEATVDSALSTSNPTKANQLWLRAMQISIDDAPAIWLYEDVSIGAIHRRILTPPMRDDAWYAHLADWSISPTQRIDRDKQPYGVSR